MKRWTPLLGLALVAVPTMVMAQEEMAGEMAREHDMMAEEVTAAITALGVEWAEAFNAADAAAVAAFYTEDAVTLPPGKEAIEGRAAIQASMEAEFAQTEGMTISFETNEVHPIADHAIEVGGYTVESADGAHLDHGKYITVWKQTDDGWKVVRDIWNSSMSPEGGEM